MGIEAVYCKPNTSKKTPGYEIFPYLLRGMTINKANQVWALDATYIPMAKGFVYLTAVVDWASRKVLAAKVAITLEGNCWDNSPTERFFRSLKHEPLN
jgi:putative transposase